MMDSPTLIQSHCLCKKICWSSPVGDESSRFLISILIHLLNTFYLFSVFLRQKYNEKNRNVASFSRKELTASEMFSAPERKPSRKCPSVTGAHNLLCPRAVGGGAELLTGWGGGGASPKSWHVNNTSQPERREVFLQRRPWSCRWISERLIRL